MSSKAQGMKKKSKRSLTPKLRFPEFRDGPGWVEKALGDVSDVLMCKRIFASETNPNGEVPFYKIGTLGGVPDAFISKKLFEEYKSKYNFPRTSEILLTCSGTVGKCLSYDGSEAYFQDSNIVWIDNPTLEVSNEFLFSILSNVNWSTLNSTTITRIYGSDLRSLAIKFPQNEKEQQRIAECLGSLDDLIAAEGRKLAALRDHKRGLMQQLFPQPGQSQPRLRFPEFRGKGEWERTNIGQHVNLLSGFPFEGQDIVENNAGVPLMRGINITEGEIRHDPDYDRFYLGPTENLAKYRLREGDVVIGMDGSKVGKNSAMITSADAGALLVQRVARLRSDRQVTMRFIFHHVNSPKFHSYVDRINTSSGIPHISAKQIKDFPLALPGNAEQHCIADCLSTFDTQIAAQAEKIKSLKQHKRGLMQQIFPAPVQ